MTGFIERNLVNLANRSWAEFNYSFREALSTSSLDKIPKLIQEMATEQNCINSCAKQTKEFCPSGSALQNDLNEKQKKAATAIAYATKRLHLLQNGTAPASPNNAATQKAEAKRLADTARQAFRQSNQDPNALRSLIRQMQKTQAQLLTLKTQMAEQFPNEIDGRLEVASEEKEVTGYLALLEAALAALDKNQTYSAPAQKSPQITTTTPLIVEKTKSPSLWTVLLQLLDEIFGCFFGPSKKEAPKPQLIAPVTAAYTLAPAAVPKRKPTDPIGLYNRTGAECWANSVLQLVCNSPSLRKAINQSGIKPLQHLVQGYERDQREGTQTVDSNQLRALLKALPHTSIDNAWQQDAADALRGILNALGKQITFQSSSQTRSTQEDHPILSFNLAGVLGGTRIQDLFNFYIGGLQLTDQNVAITKSLAQAPDELYLEARRYDQNNKKITTALEVNDILRANDSQYLLTGCIIHQGSGIRGGHYMSLVRKANEWFLCNDARTQKISDQAAKQFISSQGTLFQYQKVQ